MPATSVRQPGARAKRAGHQQHRALWLQEARAAKPRRLAARQRRGCHSNGTPKRLEQRGAVWTGARSLPAGCAANVRIVPGPTAHPPACRWGLAVRVASAALLRLPACKLLASNAPAWRDGGCVRMPGDPRSQDLLPPQPLPEHPQRFAQLLLQFGGLGLRSAVDAAPPTLHPGRIACRPFEHERRRQPLVLSAHYSPRRRPHRPPQQHVTRPLASASRATTFPRGTRCCRHGPHRKNVSSVTFCEAGNIVLPSPATSSRLFCIFLTSMPHLERCCCHRPGHTLHTPSQSSQPQLS